MLKKKKMRFLWGIMKASSYTANLVSKDGEILMTKKECELFDEKMKQYLKRYPEIK